METYEARSDGYEVFGASMTVDTQTNVHSDANIVMCRSCQCNCILCRGGCMPEDGDAVGDVQAESALAKLLTD